MTNRHKLIVLALTVTAAGVPVAPAGAQSGVVVDPGSPTGKEYAIPFETARREAAGDHSTPSDGSRTAPLFGQGIGDDDSGDPSGGKPTGEGKSGQQSSTRPGTTSGGTVADAVQSTHTVGATVPQGGLGSTATIAAVALSVLLLGGVIGSIARRRSN